MIAQRGREREGDRDKERDRDCPLTLVCRQTEP